MRTLSPLLQARLGEPYREVSVSGQVRSPCAYALAAELVRYETGDDEYRNAEVIEVDLEAAKKDALIREAGYQTFDHDE